MNTTLVTIEVGGKKRHFELLGVLEEHEVMNVLPTKVGPGVFKLLSLEHVQRTLPAFGVKDEDRVVELDEKGQPVPKPGPVPLKAFEAQVYRQGCPPRWFYVEVMKEANVRTGIKCWLDREGDDRPFTLDYVPARGPLDLDKLPKDTPVLRWSMDGSLQEEWLVELKLKKEEQGEAVRPKTKAELTQYLKGRLSMAALLEKQYNDMTVQQMAELDQNEVVKLPWVGGVTHREMQEVLRDVLPQPGHVDRLLIGCYEYLGVGRAASSATSIEDTMWRDATGRMLYSFRGVRYVDMMGDMIMNPLKALWDGFTWALNEKEATAHAQAMHVELIGTPVLWRQLHMLELPGMVMKHETVLRRERKEGES